MSKLEHKPGPWALQRGSLRDEIRAADGSTVCDWDHRGRSEAPSDADGRLLAAAPRLLEACEAVARAYASDQLYDKFPLPLVLAAIAEATETPSNESGGRDNDPVRP